MKGIIQSVMARAYKKGKSLLVVQRYLKIQHKITADLGTLKTRFKNMSTTIRDKERY